jgi:hypothetical protein
MTLKAVVFFARYVGQLTALASTAALITAGMLTCAHAHSASTAYLHVTAEADETLSVNWRIALRDLDVLLDLDADGDGRLTWGEVAARAGAIRSLAADSLRIERGNVTCSLNFEEPRYARDGDLSFAELNARTACAGGAGQSWSLSYRLFNGIDPTHRALVALANEVQPRLLAPGQMLTIAVTAASASTPPATFGAFVREGIGHILSGIDHLLFLIALMLPAVLERRDGVWRRRTDLRRAFAQVAWIATAFTLAHSITLAIAAFNVLRVAPRIIEPLVAVTVLAAALNNIRPIVTTRLALLAFCFGLIHGFAFAEVLAPLALPRAQLALALLGFNLGVESGQLLVVGATFTVLALAGRWRGYSRWVLQGGSLAVALLACAWIVERVFAFSLLPTS